jgi:hypothetical protein
VSGAPIKKNNLARNLNSQDDKFFNLEMHRGRHRLRPQSTSEKPAMADIEHYLNWPTGSEDLSVEYNPWLSEGQKAGAKLAKHIVALCNRGGGYLPVWNR